MPRPRRCRTVCRMPAFDMFSPQGADAEERVVLTVDEYEIIRLIDLEKLTHEECAKQMGVSRTTVTECCESAHKKIADCIVNGKALTIQGGDYKVCEYAEVCFCRNRREGNGSFNCWRRSCRNEGGCEGKTNGPGCACDAGDEG